MKLTLDDKLKIIKLYEEGYTIPQLSKKFKVGDSTIVRVERQFREHGLNSFKEKGKNNYYSPEFKLEIIQRVLSGESTTAIAAEIAVNDGMIFSWLKKYRELGYNGLINQKKGRPPKMRPNDVKDIKSDNSLELNESALSNDERKEFEQLKERNKQLEMENDLLKKLRALVQQRTQQQEKKK